MLCRKKKKKKSCQFHSPKSVARLESLTVARGIGLFPPADLREPKGRWVSPPLDVGNTHFL